MEQFLKKNKTSVSSIKGLSSHRSDNHAEQKAPCTHELAVTFHPIPQRFCCFSLGQDCFQGVVFPFGFSSAPRVFSELMLRVITTCLKTCTSRPLILVHLSCNCPQSAWFHSKWKSKLSWSFPGPNPLETVILNQPEASCPSCRHTALL